MRESVVYKIKAFLPSGYEVGLNDGVTEYIDLEIKEMNSTGAINFFFSEAINWPDELSLWNNTSPPGKDAIEINITSSTNVEAEFSWDIIIESNNTFTV